MYVLLPKLQISIGVEFFFVFKANLEEFIVGIIPAKYLLEAISSTIGF